MAKPPFLGGLGAALSPFEPIWAAGLGQSPGE